MTANVLFGTGGQAGPSAPAGAPLPVAVIGTGFMARTHALGYRMVGGIFDLPRPVVLGVSDEVVVGESVVVIGNPIGLEHTMTDGMVSSRRVYEGKRYIQMSAPVSPGNSGGPVFDEHGDVIGVTVAKLWGENLNLAIPIDVLKPMIKSEYPSARGFGESRW